MSERIKYGWCSKFHDDSPRYGGSPSAMMGVATVRKLVEILNNPAGAEAFDALKEALMGEFGDQYNDIGDASNGAELLGNQAIRPHDGYTFRDFVSAVSDVLLLHVVPDAIAKDAEYMNEQHWIDLGAWRSTGISG